MHSTKSEMKLQMQGEKVDMREAVDAGLGVTESSGTKPDIAGFMLKFQGIVLPHNAVDADIGPIDSNVEYLRANLNIKGMSNSRRTSLSNVDYMLYPSLLRTVTDWKGKPSLRSTERSLLHDNIIPKPDLALELGKSISLTEAEEEAVAREVHATHARIVSGPDPEPMQEDQTGSDSGKLHVSLAGPNPEHMDDEFLATAYPKVHENLKLITDERVIDDNPESHSGSMSSMKNLEDTDNFGDQFLDDKPTEDDQENDSTIPDP
ncbi:hypothetical protein Tco_1238727, partial [Tanacetum coccineum]